MQKQQVEWSEKRRRRRWLMSNRRPEETFHWFRRWMVRLSVAFAVNAVLVIPFFKGNFLHQYWQTVGNVLLFLCLCLFIASIFLAGMTYTFWALLRDLRKIDSAYPKAHT